MCGQSYRHTHTHTHETTTVTLAAHARRGLITCEVIDCRKLSEISNKGSPLCTHLLWKVEDDKDLLRGYTTIQCGVHRQLLRVHTYNVRISETKQDNTTTFSIQAKYHSYSYSKFEGYCLFAMFTMTAQIIIFIVIKFSDGSIAMYETWRIGVFLYVESFNKATFSISLPWKVNDTTCSPFFKLFTI